jgi:26S proteasome regulatory subunit N5
MCEIYVARAKRDSGRHLTWMYIGPVSGKWRKRRVKFQCRPNHIGSRDCTYITQKELSAMSSDPFQKPQKDFTETLNEQFVQIDGLVKTDYKTALDKLLLLEKQTRQASDGASSKRIMVKLVEILVAANDWKLLDEQITLLSKKHGQLKDSIQALVQEVLKSLDVIKDLDTKMTTIETIRVITENKIFVEIERAKATKILSDILLNEKNDLDKACEVLSELQVETYASMELEDKISFILDQITLNNMKGDFQFSKLLSRKILVRTLEKFSDLKLRYYQLITDIALFENDYENIVKYNMNMYNIPKIYGDAEESLKYLKQIAIYVVLSPYSNLQSDLITRVAMDKNLTKLAVESELIKVFTTKELISWRNFEGTVVSDLLKDEAFNYATEKGKLHLEDLKNRVIEFNLRVVSMYYSEIKLDRLCELLELDQLKTETFIIDLVNKGDLYAKINRPFKVVNFVKPKTENELLNEWSGNIDNLLESIETIEHLINKEEMIHASSN